MNKPKNTTLKSEEQTVDLALQQKIETQKRIKRIIKTNILQYKEEILKLINQSKITLKSIEKTDKDDIFYEKQKYIINSIVSEGEQEISSIDNIIKDINNIEKLFEKNIEIETIIQKIDELENKYEECIESHYVKETINTINYTKNIIIIEEAGKKIEKNTQKLKEVLKEMNKPTEG